MWKQGVQEEIEVQVGFVEIGSLWGNRSLGWICENWEFRRKQKFRLDMWKQGVQEEIEVQVGYVEIWSLGGNRSLGWICGNMEFMGKIEVQVGYVEIGSLGGNRSLGWICGNSVFRRKQKFGLDMWKQRVQEEIEVWVGYV